MKDLPIIFSAPMILALLAGRKTMTRRLATSPLRKVEPGDRLYVRENFARGVEDYGDVRSASFVRYMATDERATDNGTPLPWKPSIHMPRRFSRLTLVVTGVKVEPLNSITDDDAEAEGVSDVWHDFDCRSKPSYPRDEYCPNGCGSRSYSEVFRRLWESLHGQGSWAANPDVVALSFTVHRINIDAMERAAA